MHDKMKKQDPLLIIFQIISLQCLFYATMGAIFMGCNLVFGLPLSMDRFFLVDENTLAGKSESYYEDVLVVLASALAGSFLLRTIVEKSRKCLDFSVTLYLVHFGACMLYSRFVMPSLGWWIVHFVALVITVVLGEYLCSRRELQEIPLVPLVGV